MTQPLLPFTYADLVDVDDLDPFARETTSDLEALEQDVLHVIRELSGTNLDDPDRGVGADLFLSGTAAQLAALPARIEAELVKDPRVDAVDVPPPALQSDGKYFLDVNVQADGSVLGLRYSYSAQAGLQVRS